MTPSALPQRCWRPLDEVKAYIEKFPDGVDLTQLHKKVNCYGVLKRKDKELVINHLEQRESILVIKAKPINHVGREKTFLRHKKYGYPRDIEGYVYPVRDKKPEPQKTIEMKKPEVKPMTLDAKASPEALRKQAEELLKAAEKAEREANENDLFNKKLAPVKLEILQSVGAVQRKFDELMDCMGTLEKAAQKLKEISA